MVKYTSRVGQGGAVKKRAPKKRNSPAPLEEGVGGAVGPGGSLKPKKGGVVASGGSVEERGVIGGDSRSAGAVASGASVRPASSEANRRGGSVSSGGALRTGGAVTTGGMVKKIDVMGYPQMYHILGHMEGGEYHTLQGLAAAHLADEGHPLKRPIMASLGGSFVHPRNISKVATKDVLKAPNGQALSRALYTEFLDSLSGRPTGGGLLDSLKNLLKKGVQGVAKGAKGALKIGKTLASAINRGTDIAKLFAEPISAISPGVGEILKKGLGAAERIQKGLQTGVSVGEKISEGLSQIAEE